MTPLICASIILSTVPGVLTMSVPIAAPPMTTNSDGWLRTSSSPPAIR